LFLQGQVLSHLCFVANEKLSQLYLNKDRAASETLIQKVEKLGAKAIVFTVDVMWQSKRTMDVRAKLPSPAEAAAAAAAPAPASVSHAISGYQDYNLTWSDLAFIRVRLRSPFLLNISAKGWSEGLSLLVCANLKLLKKNTKLPIIVKGVQSVEDVQLCADHGVQGVILVSESPMVQNEPSSKTEKTDKSCFFLLVKPRRPPS
jgi:L-lactate dehydrogenase (cytochrome)